jgi:dolichyl-phosphate-mannose--protein O-mannosyl transferase/Gpi18-like mannosyltransferase
MRFFSRVQRVSTASLIAGCVFFLLASICAAAENPGAVGGHTGKVPGAISGVLLLALVCYSIYIYAKPLLKKRDRSVVYAIAILFSIALLKILLLPWFDGYANDISSYESWALQMASQGPSGIYRAGYFLDYPPGYLYALWAAGMVAKASAAGGVMLRIIVETPAVLADFLLALVAFFLVRRLAPQRRSAAYVTMLLVALNPALCFDTIVWGQSDSALTVVILLSAAIALDGEFELAWALAALSVLVKPQALMYVPVLGFWTLLKLPVAQWWRSAAAVVVTALIGVLPFQTGHRWNWIFELYHSTAAYYHETSVNAFNLMALLGGLRKPDAETFAGVSYFSLGMGLLVPLYAFIAWRLWREGTPRAFMFAIFAAMFGFFMVAPRMHERYLYAGLVFAVPLAVEGSEMAAVFAILTATCLFNLEYVLHTLRTIVFLNPRDAPAMAASAINVMAFAFAIDYGFGLAAGEGPLWGRMMSVVPGEAENPGGRISGAAERRSEPLVSIPWLRADTIVLALLIAAAAATRLWRLGFPAEIVFDEVHFVAQARHYIRAEPFLDPHPPLAKLVIAAGILIFGDHPWSWRIGNALCGILLVALTYMLGRRMFGSRLAGALAASFIVCDGMFLVDSRIAVIDIVYLTLAAWSYLLLFRFAESNDTRDRRMTLAAMGVTLGLCLGSKLYIPAITFLLCAGFMTHFILRFERAAPLEARAWRAFGAWMMVGCLGAIFYLLVFLPHFALGWWAGIADLFHYYGDVMWYERSVEAATHPYASPWWSWPLMLRPIAYWQNFPPQGKVATIWGGGNPLLWWSALTAIVITAVRAIERPNAARTFLMVGYLSYLAIWVPVGRTLFLYHYMPSVYLAYLALAAIVAEAWFGKAELWECAALLATIVPVCVLGLGSWPGTMLGGAVAALAAYLLAADVVPSMAENFKAHRWAPRLVAVMFLGAAAILFIYYFPIWTAISIERAGYYHRMWFQGPGLRNWI